MSAYEITTVVVAIFALAVAVAAAGSAKSSVIEARRQADSAKAQADLAHAELERLRQRIAMISDPAHMFEILPTWYVQRMGQDDWGFALLLRSSEILAISRINGISTDGKWMEVTLLEKGTEPTQISGKAVTYAPTDRREASVQIAAVEAAFELWTS